MSKREQRKSLLLLCRAGAGSITRSGIKGENGKPAPMSETESSLSRFTANAAGVQTHEWD